MGSPAHARAARWGQAGSYSSMLQCLQICTPVRMLIGLHFIVMQLRCELLGR